MIYNDGTDDESLDFRVHTPNGRVVYSNPENIIFVGKRKKTVDETKEDDLSKYYDYDCDQSDQLDIEEKDAGIIYARIAFGALVVGFVSVCIGICIESGVLAAIAFISFVVMFIFALMYNGKDSFYE